MKLMPTPASTQEAILARSIHTKNLESRIKDLESRIKRLEEALRWYADEQNYTPEPPFWDKSTMPPTIRYPLCHASKTTMDCGARARAALEGK